MGFHGVTVHEKTSLHTAHFFQTKTDRKLIQSKPPHPPGLKKTLPSPHWEMQHPPCFVFLSTMESGFVFPFSFMVPPFPKLFLLCASEPGERRQRRRISFSTETNQQRAHSRSLHAAAYVIAAALIYWLFRRVSGGYNKKNPNNRGTHSFTRTVYHNKV